MEQKEPVAIGASVGAGCQPCTSHDIDTAHKAGLPDDRLLAAVTNAEQVTAEAKQQMAVHAWAQLAAEATVPVAAGAIEDELASIGAALGANDWANIERHMQAAALGVSRSQVQRRRPSDACTVNPSYAGAMTSRPAAAVRLRAVWNAILGGIGTIVGLAPHVLHHVGLLAGTAIIAGTGGTVLFGVIGLAASIPLLLRLRKRFGTWWAPVIGLTVFAAMFAVSAFVIGPLINDTNSPAPAPAGPGPTPDQHGHHG